MTTNYLSPVFNEQTFNASGDPLVGGQIETYVAGTSTPLATYTTQSGTTQQANPIILNARGETTNPIWLGAGKLYKFVLKDSLGSVLRTFDDIGGVNDTSISVSEWQSSGYTPTYISTVSFSVIGDKTSDFTAGRRIRSTNSGGTIYSTIASSSYSSGSGLTTVTVINDSGTLDSGLSAVDIGILTAINPSVPNSQAVRQAMGLGYGQDIASAATLNLTARTGFIVRITGTTGPITALTMANGDMVMLEMVSTPTFNVSGVLSYTCTAGDNVLVWQDGNGTQGAVVYKKGQVPTFVDSAFNLTASVAANALTITLKAGGWWFRNPTLGTGEFEYVSTASDLTLTISSGSTLGGTNGVQMDIVARVVNDAGTLRLTAENRAGGMDVSEMSVISTTAEGGSGGADSATTIYSGTAVTSKAYRTVGIVRSTQATAGTWATAPSLIQGVEGQALISRVGPMTDTTVSIGTTYTSTNKDALYNFVGTGQNGVLCQIGITINGVGPKMFAQAYAGASATGYWNGSVLIPANARFTLSAIAGSPSSTVSTFYQELN